MKAGTGHGWFEILRLSGFPNPTRRGLERRGFSREFLSRPEDPKNAALATKTLFMHSNIAGRVLDIFVFLHTLKDSSVRKSWPVDPWRVR